MNSSIFYIEYLINGAVTLAFGILLFSDFPGMESLKVFNDGSWTAIALVPIAYVLGVVIEVIGAFPEWVLREKKERSGKGVESEFSGSKIVDIFAWNEHVGYQLQRRRSRDRMVRGASMNMVVLSVCLAGKQFGEQTCSGIILLVVSVIAAIALLWVWVAFFDRTLKFKESALVAAQKALGKT